MKRLLFICLFSCLSACSLSPFVDVRREAGTTDLVGRSTRETVAVCYNALTTTPAAVRAVAEQECAKQKKHAVFIRQTEASCRLLLPAHAYYACRP